jgi:hypothetical protein
VRGLPLSQLNTLFRGANAAQSRPGAALACGCEAPKISQLIPPFKPPFVALRGICGSFPCALLHIQPFAVKDTPRLFPGLSAGTQAGRCLFGKTFWITADF